MKLTQNAIVHVLLVIAILPAIALIYFLLARPGEGTLSLAAWGAFSAAALFLVIVTFAPSVARRWKGLPAPEPLGSGGGGNSPFRSSGQQAGTWVLGRHLQLSMGGKLEVTHYA